MTSQVTAAAADPVAAKEFSIRSVKLRSVAFHAPAVPESDQEQLNLAEVQVTVNREPRQSPRRDTFQLTLTVEVQAGKDGVDLFRAVVEEVGVFRVVGYSNEEALALLKTKGAEMVYPYAREMVLSMVGRCGISQLGLKPMSFDLPDSAPSPA